MARLVPALARAAVLTAVVLGVAIAIHLAFGDAILWRPVLAVAGLGVAVLVVVEWVDWGGGTKPKAE